MIKFIIFLLSLGTSYSFADSNNSKEIEKFAETLVFEKYRENFEVKREQKLNIEAIPVTNRLTLEQCKGNLQGKIVGDKIKSKTSVKISCDDNKKWNLYVRVKVQILMPVVIASSSLNKGEILNASNMKLIYRPESLIRGSVFSNTQILNGTRLKKNVRSEKNIRHKDICYVCKNDKVIIIADKNGLIIKASGIALTDGNIGNTVKIENSRTHRIVTGTVYALNEVHVSF